MELNWKIIDDFLIGEAQTDDISCTTKKEIEQFLPSHDFNAFSEESLEQLAGIWDLSYKDYYEEQTNTRIPNIFNVIALNEDEGEEDERQTLSSW